MITHYLVRRREAALNAWSTEEKRLPAALGWVTSPALKSARLRLRLWDALLDLWTHGERR